MKEKNNKILFFLLFLVLFLVGMYSILILIKPNFLVKPVDQNTNKVYKIGILPYEGKDTYVSTIINELESLFKKIEFENDMQVRVDIFDSKDNQSIQNSQIDKYISLSYDLLIINMVDRTEASSVIDKAMAGDIPIIFFNREPVTEDMKRWEKIYYVGFDAKESAKLQAQIIIDKYNNNPSLIDKNNDGVIQYIILEGESRHQDSLIRTEKSIEYLKSGGLELNRLQGVIANWSRTQAAALMDNFFKEFGDEIELVISNNDDMALGTIDTILENNIDFNNIVGIDGTPQGINAVNKNQMLGTVSISAKDCADTISKISMSLLTSNSIDPRIKLVDNIYVWVDQSTIISKD